MRLFGCLNLSVCDLCIAGSLVLGAEITAVNGVSVDNAASTLKRIRSATRLKQVVKLTVQRASSGKEQQAEKTVEANTNDEVVDVSLQGNREPLGIKFVSADPMAAARIHGFTNDSRANGKPNKSALLRIESSFDIGGRQTA